MNQVFAPGCGLLIYKPELADRIFHVLRDKTPGLTVHTTCCHHEPEQPEGTRITNVCAGCDRRYRELYPGVSTISLWEQLAEDPDFPFPDYGQQQMSIIDACPTRTQERVHEAVRVLLKKMNIKLIEPERTRTGGACCGDSFYGVLPVDQVKGEMKKRAMEMPAEDVVVYCVSCIKAMHIGGRHPRYLVDLLFGETTHPGTFEPDLWHAELDAFIETH